jgi:hypothetical protein
MGIGVVPLRELQEGGVGALNIQAPAVEVVEGAVVGAAAFGLHRPDNMQPVFVTAAGEVETQPGKAQGAAVNLAAGADRRWCCRLQCAAL